MDKHKILQDALDHYGILWQSLKLAEECGELIQAVSNTLTAMARGVRNMQSYYDCVAQELADVEILTEQIRLFFNITRKQIEDEKERKLHRLSVDYISHYDKGIRRYIRDVLYGDDE